MPGIFLALSLGLVPHQWGEETKLLPAQSLQKGWEADCTPVIGVVEALMEEAQGIIEVAQGRLNSVLVGEDLRYGGKESSAKAK